MKDNETLMLRNKNWFRISGNILILCSILLILYIYLPFLALFIPLPKAEKFSSTYSSEYTIEIPKINANAPIIENVDPWNKSDYEQKLKQGVGLAKGFANVGDKGTVFMFAHSSLPPWEMTRANTSFLRLNELNNGDEINVNKQGQMFNFKVTKKMEVWPNEVSLIKSESKDQLILQTCTPIGTDLKRLLVFAEPIQ
jgi:LPXTG-site transpeptidase (sortase) family protein